MNLQAILTVEIAACGAVSFIAYNHHTEYAERYRMFAVLFYVAGAIATVWNYALLAAQFSAKPFIPASKITAAMSAMDYWSVPTSVVAALMGFGFFMWIARLVSGTFHKKVE